MRKLLVVVGLLAVVAVGAWAVLGNVGSSNAATDQTVNTMVSQSSDNGSEGVFGSMVGQTEQACSMECLDQAAAKKVCSGACAGMSKEECIAKCNGMTKEQCLEICKTKGNCSGNCSVECKDKCSGKCSGNCSVECKEKCSGQCSAECKGKSDCSAECKKACQSAIQKGCCGK